MMTRAFTKLLFLGCLLAALAAVDARRPRPGRRKKRRALKSSRSGSYTYYVQNGNIIPPANIQSVSSNAVQGVSGGTNQIVSFTCGKGSGPCPSAVQGFQAVQGVTYDVREVNDVQGVSGCGKGNGACFGAVQGVNGVQGVSSFSGKGSKGFGIFNPVVTPVTNPVTNPVVTPVASK